MIENTLGIQKELFDLLKPFDWQTMIEIGNKTSQGGHKGTSFKSMFQEQGIKHTSIDLNGRNGALQLDLSKPITLDTSDILTNFGTSEHVKENQEQVFRNMHNLSHYRMVHALPRVNNWPHHGYWHIDLDFIEKLAKLNNYEIQTLFILNDKPRQLVCCSLKKLADSEFVWSEDMPLHYNKTTRGTVISYE